MPSPQAQVSPSSDNTPASPDAPGSPQGPVLEADDNIGDIDSLNEGSIQSDTTSIASSVIKYRLENGRRYHGFRDGAYSFPNDDTENERLDLQHNLMCLTFDGKLHVSPAGSDRPLNRVMDAGTGTGIWALDFADEHPESEVIGIDLSPIQPSFVPPNLSFIVDDLEAPWAHGSDFDLIYVRMLTGALGNWKRFMEQSLEHLRPGGWIELVDIGNVSCDDGTLPKDSYIEKWTGHMNDAAAAAGRRVDTAQSHPQQLRDAGFVNVTTVVYKWPTNSWPKDPKYKELGTWVNETMSDGLQAFSLALFTRVLGWSPEEVEVFNAMVRKDVRNRNYHAYWPIAVTYGQKAEAGNASI